MEAVLTGGVDAGRQGDVDEGDQDGDGAQEGQVLSSTNIEPSVFKRNICVNLKTKFSAIDVSGGSLARTEVRRPGVDQIGKQEEQRVTDSLEKDVVLQSI